MTKEEQRRINGLVETVFERSKNDKVLNTKRLRTCSAYVLETEDAYILQSYRTVVAIIDKATRDMFDGLRYVYGYTSTSAQHIAKFCNDYSAGKRYTWREV